MFPTKLHGLSLSAWVKPLSQFLYLLSSKLNEKIILTSLTILKLSISISMIIFLLILSFLYLFVLCNSLVQLENEYPVYVPLTSAKLQKTFSSLIWMLTTLRLICYWPLSLQMGSLGDQVLGYFHGHCKC